jgi:hypothetical protein
MYVRNFSKHDLNGDQRRALRKGLGEVRFESPSAPFFQSAAHLRQSIEGHTSVVVAPGAMLLELWAEATERPMQFGTTIVVFGQDQAARQRGRFAAASISIFGWMERDGYPQPTLVYQADICPTVENNFSDGQEFPYGTPKES